MEHLIPIQEVIPEKFLNPLVHSLEAKVVFYNFETYPCCPLRTLWDLTLPEWKGRVQMKDPMLTEENMNFLQMVVMHADQMAAAYEAEFGEPLKLSPGIPNAGYEERPPMTCSVASSKLRYNASKGTKLAICWNLLPVTGITKRNFLLTANLAPHPNAAKLLIRFMLGDSHGGGGFAPWNVPGGWSPRTDVPPKVGSLDMLHQYTWFLDTQWIYEHGLEVQDFWLAQ
jgi:iron(III) transport system substrate-binding protein